MSGFRHSLLVPLLALACGGSGSSTPQHGAPVAQAGADRAVSSGALVTLDGGASSDPAGLALGYQWTQVSGPMVTLSSTAAAQTTFTAPSLASGSPPVTLVFSLRVSSASGTSISTVTVTVNAPRPVNPPPVASAGPNQSVTSGAVLVTLDGSASVDPDGQAISYSWTQASGPPLTLAAASTAHPTFTAPSLASASPPVTLVFSLVVTDVDASSLPSTVTIVVNPAGGGACGSGVPPPPPGTPPPATEPTPPPVGGNGSHRFEIGTDLGTGGLTVVDPAAGEPTVEGLVVVSFASPGGPAPADAVVTLNGVPLTRPPNGLYWHVDPVGPQPRVGSGGTLLLVATATDPASGKQIQRSLALQCPPDISVTLSPPPGAPLVPSTAVNLTSNVNILFNQASPLFSVYGPKATLRGYDPCTRALGDGVSSKDIVTANGFNVDVPVLATTSGAYLLDVRWPGPGFLDGQTGGYCQLAKRFFFRK